MLTIRAHLLEQRRIGTDPTARVAPPDTLRVGPPRQIVLRAERQQRAVEISLRDVQDYLESDDLGELDMAVSSLQEALFGLNRRISAEKRVDNNPIQGIKNTFGSLKDELFSDDYWDEDPWDYQPSSRGMNSEYTDRERDRWDNDFYN